MIITDKMKVGPWVAREIVGCFHPDESEAIGLERGGKMVAGVFYENWNGKSIMAHAAFRGLMTPRYLYAIFHYPFIVVGADVIVCPIASNNKESINISSKMGFTREATLRDAHPHGDLYLYTLRRDQCRYLGDRYGKKCWVTAACA
jgi:RimJ/RimL family protein N-acetyltransferase